MVLSAKTLLAMRDVLDILVGIGLCLFYRLCSAERLDPSSRGWQNLKSFPPQTVCVEALRNPMAALQDLVCVH